MSVIIRLQNLPWSANALDIRQYFQGLSIPEGGVHIVGGELGDAFIAFSTDEDARQAFQLNNGKIKEVQITLLLSSRSEMHKVIEAARNAQMPFMQTVPTPKITPTLVPPVTAPPPVLDLTKDDDKDKPKDDLRSRRDKERRRSRSKSRDRKDRSRDRRDRKRGRDRSRSRDRRDRRRDRRDRSRSRDRTRSKDRELRRGRDQRDNSHSQDRTMNANNRNSMENRNDLPKPNVWDNNVILPQGIMPPQNNLGTFPNAINNFDNFKRNTGSVDDLQHKVNSPNLINDNDMFPRQNMTNPLMPRDWNKRPGRFDRNSMMGDNMNAPMNNQFPHNQNRPMLLQNTIGMPLDIRPNFFPGQNNLRPSFGGDGMMGLNRPLLNRPGMLPQDPYRLDRGNMDFPGDYPNAGPRNNANSGCCIQLKPYFGGYADLKKFFHGLYIDNNGVKFIHDKTGKKTGQIYVKFIRPEHKQQSLDNSGLHVRGYKVEISHLDDAEFEGNGNEDNENAEDQPSHDFKGEENEPGEIPDKPYNCVVVDNLPVYAKEHEILKLFSDFPMLSVHMTVNKQNLPLAYIQFNNDNDAKRVVENNNFMICGRPVKISPCYMAEFNEVVNQETKTTGLAPLKVEEVPPTKEESNDHNLGHAEPPPEVVLMTGMPFKTTDRDVIDFFSDIGLVPSRIHMMFGQYGPSGECYCEFSTSVEAVLALDKDGMPLGTGIVRVETRSRSEMEMNLNLPPTNSTMNQNMNPHFPGQGRFGPRGPNMMGPRPPNMRRRPPFHNRPTGLNMPGGPSENMGPSSCVVTLENVPFGAGVNEILNIFPGFDLTSHNVFRRYSDNGKPTGDARVTFQTPGEARRAVQECRFQKIRDRVIFLKQM